MPQASAALQKEWGTEESKAVQYLLKRGWRSTPSYTWMPPKSHQITPKELRAIRFLFEEWDWGLLD